MLQSALEIEATEFIGRTTYQRRQEDQAIYRNGYKRRKVATGGLGAYRCDHNFIPHLQHRLPTCSTPLDQPPRHAKPQDPIKDLAGANCGLSHCENPFSHHAF